jgi:uncharacterized protein YegL
MKWALMGMIWLLASLLTGPAGAQRGPRLDVAFMLDATGSMGDEIGAVKERIAEMIAEIAVGDPAPDVRFGIVAYRDRGDEYITQVHELTRDIDRVVANLDRIEAAGGGDYAESLVEALHTVVHDLNWDPGSDISRLVFLIADAPPHLDYEGDYDYIEEYQMAAELGITVHAMGASGLDEKGEQIFREIATGTGGDFQWLAYESRYVATDGEEVIVVVEGRTATYTKGDSTWSAEGGFSGPFSADGGVRRDDASGAAEYGTGSGISGSVEAPADGGAASTSTNLADLITKAVRDAAEARGVEYEGTTTIEQASWARIKQSARQKP